MYNIAQILEPPPAPPLLPVPHTLLAMDTSGDVCSVACLRNGQLISEHTFRHGMHLSERLLEHVTAVLQDTSVLAQDVTAFAVGLGPGSFTGARIGVMTMKTFASLLDRPLYGVDSLAAIARAYLGLNDVLIIPMHPCRAGIVYTGLYDASTNQPAMILKPSALAISELVAEATKLSYSKLLFTGQALDKYRGDLQQALGSALDRALWGSTTFPRASDVGAIAWARITLGIPPDDPLSLAPQYVSPPPITMPKGIPMPPEA